MSFSAGVRLLFLAAACFVSAKALAAEIPLGERRSGYELMARETRAIQDDEPTNPGMLWVLDGEALWNRKAGAADRSCADCHADARESMKAVAARYPAFDAARGRPVNLAYEPVDAAGGTNCAAGLLPSYLGAAGATVPVEQILRWDPEVILVQGNYLPAERTVTLQSILRDPRLASLKAVRAGRVHYTFGFWYWWDPALVLVETLYLARLLHPREFPAFDFEKEGNEIFRKFYGIDGAFTALAKILNCHEWVRN